MSTTPAIEITCPRCKHTWPEKIENLEKLDQEIYRDVPTKKRVEQYRTRCPQCHTYFIVDVQVEEDDHA